MTTQTLEYFDTTTANPGRSGESREAYFHISKFDRGDAVVIRDDQGREHAATIIRRDRQAGSFGSFESEALGASLGPGRYTFNVTNAVLTAGRLNVRHAEPALSS